MRKLFFGISATSFAAIAVLSYFVTIHAMWALLFLLPLFIVGTRNTLQTKKAILRNYPLLGMLRYFFEEIRPEIQQYFVENDIDGSPVPRSLRSLVYQRAKQQTDTLPFGTQRDVYSEGYEWISHSMSPKEVTAHELRVKVGGPACKQPYFASIFNISAMSYGALSRAAVQALNGGAKLGGFYHNTGEGGVSPYHLMEGGDLVWQVGTGYFGCRNMDGTFSPDLFRETAIKPNIKMIEIKLSQGAKPSHGGILPAAKITPEIMEIRKVVAGKDVISPPAHREFSDPSGLLVFVQRLRELSGGKPVGFKFCLGQPSEFIAICKAMLETKIQPDFITIDGGEGGTGAAPLEFSDSVGAPLEEGLTFVHDVLTGFGLRSEIRVIASGKVLTGFSLFSRFALGADMCNSARGMMLALGCIQARKCNTNHCPTGVATSNENLIYGLVPSEKKLRVFNYQKNTVHAFADLLGAAGLKHPSEISRAHVNRRVSTEHVKTYRDLFPEIEVGAFLRGEIPDRYRAAFHAANPHDFKSREETRREPQHKTRAA